MPKTSTRTFECSLKGPVIFGVGTTNYLNLTVTASTGCTKASIELSGPPEVVDKATDRLDGNSYYLQLPLPPPGQRGGGLHITGGVIIGNASMVSGSGIQMVNFGGSSAGRRIIVDGADITDIVNDRRPAELKAHVRLPARSSLDCSVDSGGIQTTGVLSAVAAATGSADISIQAATTIRARSVGGDIDVEVAAGPVTINTVGGDIDVEDLRGAATLNSTGGDINVHATAAVRVEATTMGGDIRVTETPGVGASVAASSMGGRVRTPR